MVLATAKIQDFDRFWNTFSTKGAEKRKQHGCKGAQVFRDPNESDRVWAIFDWDEAGWQSFTSDPDVPAIFQEAGFTQDRPSRRSSSASTTPRQACTTPTSLSTAADGIRPGMLRGSTSAFVSRRRSGGAVFAVHLVRWRRRMPRGDV